MAILFTLRVYGRNLLPKKYFHIFVLMSNPGFELGPCVQYANTLPTRQRRRCYISQGNLKISVAKTISLALGWNE